MNGPVMRTIRPVSVMLDETRVVRDTAEERLSGTFVSWVRSPETPAVTTTVGFTTGLVTVLLSTGTRSNETVPVWPAETDANSVVVF